jgi:hypothetical protein
MVAIHKDDKIERHATVSLGNLAPSLHMCLLLSEV